MYLSCDIVKEGNEILRKKSSKVVLPLTSDDLTCIKGLYEYMVVSAVDELTEKYKIRPGVGIAAPQVGVNKRMFAMNCVDFLDEKQKKYFYAVINPIITAVSKEMVYLPGGEGCLSVERETEGLLTPRHYAITAKCCLFDYEKGTLRTVKLNLKGYPAIVFQHEYDHLDGIMYVDKMFTEEEITKQGVIPLYTVNEDEDEE